MSDEKEGWVPARILKESGDSANVQLQTGAKKSVKRSEKEPLWPLNHSSLSRIEDDLVMVDAINQVSAVLYCAYRAVLCCTRARGTGEEGEERERRRGEKEILKESGREGEADRHT